MIGTFIDDKFEGLEVKYDLAKVRDYVNWYNESAPDFAPSWKPQDTSGVKITAILV